MADPRLMSDDECFDLAGTENNVRLLLADRAARQERERADVDLMRDVEARLDSALSFRSGHARECPWLRGGPRQTCVCGLDATLAALRARLEEPHA